MSDADGGYDAKFIDEVPDMLKCCVCHFVLKNPVLVIECGHRFCECCFNQLKDYSLTRQIDLCCPLDRQVIDTTKVFPDKGIGRTVGDLQTKCEFVIEGCTWTGELRNLQSHVDKNCPRQKVQCTNESCHIIMPRIDLEKHLKFHESCSVMMSRMDLDEHLKVHQVKSTVASNAIVSDLVESMSHRLTLCEKKLEGKDEELSRCKETLKLQDLKLKQLEQQNEKLKEIHDMLNNPNVLSYYNPQFTWRIQNYQAIYKGVGLDSPIFYSSFNGYCCKLSVQWYGPNHGRLGVYIHFVRTDNYPNLQWPFNMKVHFSSEDRNGCIEHKTLTPEDSDEYGMWEFNQWESIGAGISYFLSQPKLSKHIVNDVLTIQCYFEPLHRM